MLEEFLWVEKYRPHTLDDVILPSETKKIFQQFVDQENIPNLLLSGSAGVGKTTVAKAMLDMLGADYIVVNGSLSGNIDTLRNEIMNFATTVSFSEGRKYVILDEADYLNPQSTQPALRNFMEEYSKNCGFILTCNFKNRIISPLQSRCSTVDFTYTKGDAPKLAGEFFKRVCNILETEGVPYEKPVVAEIIQKFYPDWRKVLNELQKYSATGKIDTGMLANSTEESFAALIGLLKEKNFSGMRKWVAMNVDSDPTALMRKIYDRSTEKLKPNSIPQLVLLIADYQYKAAFVSDQEVNLVAFLTQMMADCEFK
jgi:replication-associated recombination protein RarA|tara:strand:+ start:1702 stop:2640 length:939 start_codon:yes stop_codon:yes gene_type:complete